MTVAGMSRGERVLATVVLVGFVAPLCVFFAALAWRLAWSMVTGASF